MLREKLDTLRQLDGGILELEDEIIREIEHSDAYNQEVLEVLLRMKESSNGDTPATAPPIVTDRGMAGSKHNTRLPKLTLSSFDGDITQWLSFWDSYQAAIHSNTDLSDVQKFTYLKSLVERTAINGLRPTIIKKLLRFSKNDLATNKK